MIRRTLFSGLLTSIALLATTVFATPLVPAPLLAAQQATPVPTPTPGAEWHLLPTPEPAFTAPVPPEDGAIEALELIHTTDTANYYALTYWSDGLRVTGFLGRPFAPGPHPAIIHNRGGFGSTGALTGGEIVGYVEAGYVAVATQYRGNSGGEGQEDFGGDDVHDVTHLITLLRGLPDVDPHRIGMFGGSRGGMMTYIALKNLALAGRADDIKAAVTVGGIGDLFAWDIERGGALAEVLWWPLVGTTPQNDPAPFEARSAVYWPELIQVPLLMQHGDADREVATQQTYDLAMALANVGADFTTNIVPGGDHPLSAHEGGLPATLDWFGRYLGGDGVDRSYATHEARIKAAQAWFATNPQTR